MRSCFLVSSQPFLPGLLKTLSYRPLLASSAGLVGGILSYRPLPVSFAKSVDNPLRPSLVCLGVVLTIGQNKALVYTSRPVNTFQGIALFTSLAERRERKRDGERWREMEREKESV